MSIYQQIRSGFKQIELHGEKVTFVFLSSTTFAAAKSEQKFNDDFLLTTDGEKMVGLLWGAKFYLKQIDNIEFMSDKRTIIVKSEVKIDYKKKFKFILEEF